MGGIHQEGQYFISWHNSNYVLRQFDFDPVQKKNKCKIIYLNKLTSVAVLIMVVFILVVFVLIVFVLVVFVVITFVLIIFVLFVFVVVVFVLVDFAVDFIRLCRDCPYSIVCVKVFFVLLVLFMAVFILFHFVLAPIQHFWNMVFNQEFLFLNVIFFGVLITLKKCYRFVFFIFRNTVLV